MKKIIFLTVITLLTLPFSCREKDSGKAAGLDGWLKGDDQEKFETIAGQLRGFDVAMVETGYRYQELYWAGQDENWDYAQYQLDKIKLVIESGFVRRPKRAASAEHFLTVALPDMQKAVEAKDTALFNQNFALLTTSCNSCHNKENVPFFNVRAPEVRQSVIGR